MRKSEVPEILLKMFLPNRMVTSPYVITPEQLQRNGIKVVFTDLDNTLIAWDDEAAPEQLHNWIKELKTAGIELTIVSNNNEERVSKFAEEIGVPFVYRAKKPLNSGFKRAMRIYAVRRDEVAMIGDQLLTDILGGNRARLFTILVQPVKQSDAWNTKINRQIEKLTVSLLKRKNPLKWEDTL